MNGIAGIGYRNGQVSVNITTRVSSVSYAAVMNKAAAKKESVVNDYISRHPEDAAHVNGQINAGKAVLAKNGVTDVSREDMTMEEYKLFISNLLDRIPFDISRPDDREMISISDKGWEQMKKDPDYEAWILGYTVENRSVRNPFAGWPGMSGTLCIEKFGASIEEHHGQGIPLSRIEGKKAKDEDEESWWQKRHKRIEELLAEQVKIQIRQKQMAHSAYAQMIMSGKEQSYGMGFIEYGGPLFSKFC